MNNYETVNKAEFQKLYADWNNEEDNEFADYIHANWGNEFNEELNELIKKFNDKAEYLKGDKQ